MTSLLDFEKMLERLNAAIGKESDWETDLGKFTRNMLIKIRDGN